MANDAKHLHPRDPLPFLGDVKDNPGDEHRGEHADGHAQPEDHRETFDLVGSNHVEHGGRNQSGQVGVNNRGAGPLKGVANGHAQAGAPFELLAQSFVDQNVIVDRHAHRQNQTGESRQGQGRLDRQHDGEQYQQVQRQHNVGHHAGKAIVPEHEQGYQDGRDQHRAFALLDRVLP